MNSTVKMVFGLIGGLAMFLYGMNSMSDALQKTAGGKMKKVLSFLTRNPIMGALAGALVTAVLQSSSATTVMVIGFVKRRPDEPSPGNFRYFRCKHRYNHDCPADGI